jgi:hypothetical protein
MQQRMEESEVGLNAMQNRFESLIQGSVKSRTTTAQPGSPANGDRYILPTGPTGAVWGTFTAGRIAIYYDGWEQLTPKEGWRVWVDDEDCMVQHDGTAGAVGWFGGATLGITASTTQAQGNGPLVNERNEITVCANANDTVTLPGCRNGKRVVVTNQGAQTARIYPASGDSINALGANNPITLAAGGSMVFEGFNDTKWYSVS